MITKRDTRIPRRPLLWLAAALLFVLPPMFDGLAAWVPTLLLLAIAAKFWMEPRGYRLRFLPLKLALVAAAVVAIFISYGAIKGIEPGVSLIIVLMSLKIFEAHTAREFHFMVMLGWVLCLCGFFLAQDLAIAVCIMIGFTLLTTALVQFYRGLVAGRIWPPLRGALTLLAQAVPLIVLLFLLFPRVTTGFRLLLTPNATSASGFSDRLSPGSVESLASSTAVAFRAEFPDGDLPPRTALYWRGLVMTQGDGMEWRSRDTSAVSNSSQELRRGNTIRQWITIEPHGEHWMFALDRPVTPSPGAILTPGNYLWSWQAIMKPRRYEVKSSLALARQDLQPRERERLLEVPASISPRVRELAQSWRAADPDSRAIVRRALDFFQTQRFRYSFSPGEYRKNDLEEFLFRRRIGFCEHYAASFATLMRLAGVPARVVVGYLGGEFNEMGRFYLVRQSDAHAWGEVWLPDTGWTRIDPTNVVAPERVSLGLESFLERSAGAGEIAPRFRRTFARQPFFAKIRVTWQTLNYAWDSRVLGFDAEAQQALTNEIGLPDLRPVSLLFLSAIVAAGFVVILATWIQFRSRVQPDPVQGLYTKFCAKAARLGAPRDPAEGPVHFASRVSRVLPQESERIATISDCYIGLRYARDSDAASLHAFAREVQLFGSGTRKNRNSYAGR
jgi:transglutaminase-like putative cysteine protease